MRWKKRGESYCKLTSPAFITTKSDPDEMNTPRKIYSGSGPGNSEATVYLSEWQTSAGKH